MNNLEPKAILAVEIESDQCRSLAYHSHMANEYSFCLKGKGAHETAMGNVPFDKGTLCFFPRGQMHSHHISSKECSLISVRFRDEALLSQSRIDEDARLMLSYFRYRAYMGRHSIPLDGGTGKKILRLFGDAVEEERAKAGGYQNMLKGYALQALVILTRLHDYDFEAHIAHSPVGMIELLSMIDAIPAGEYSVEEMAAMAHLSRSHFHAKFKALTGTTLIEHITRLRVGLACRYLAHTDLSVTEVCFETGFNSVSRFYNAFNFLTGMSPKAWRKARTEP
ncbi:MAG: helix-turn-helix transcriptional regulator [Planctomycetes bacterium]|nr:helix-turn-helix transcriptional regulator [Planctomycetota bacterium]